MKKPLEDLLNQNLDEVINNCSFNTSDDVLDAYSKQLIYLIDMFIGVKDNGKQN